MAPKATDLMTAKTVRRNRRLDSVDRDGLATARYISLDDKLAAIQDRHLGMAEHQNEQVKLLVDMLIQDRWGDMRTPDAPVAPVRHLHAVK